MGLVEDLAQLVELRARGVLTDADFHAAKTRVLSAGARTAAPVSIPVPVGPAQHVPQIQPVADTPAGSQIDGATTPRRRRLASDQQQLFTAFSAHPYIRVEPLGPAPAQKYRLIYNVPGLHLTPANELVTAHQHIVEMNLVGGYPREKPYCVSLSPIFHPNFANHICIADYWSPSQALVDVVIQIGDMLQYKSYNIQSPLSALAAKWAVENAGRLPIGHLNLYPQEPEIRFTASRDVAVAATEVHA